MILLSDAQFIRPKVILLSGAQFIRPQVILLSDAQVIIYAIQYGMLKVQIEKIILTISKFQPRGDFVCVWSSVVLRPLGLRSKLGKELVFAELKVH